MAQQSSAGSPEKKHNPILIPKAHQEILDAFIKANNLTGYGEAIQALINCYRDDLKIKQGLDKRKEGIDQRETELSAAEQEFLAYERQLRNGAGVTQQTFDLITSLLETTDRESIEALAELIQAGGVPVTELTRGLQKIGGLANSIHSLEQLQEAHRETEAEIERQVKELEGRRLELTKEIITGRKEIEGIAGEKEQARQEVQQIMMAGKAVEAGYSQLGIILDNVIVRLLGAGIPITSLAPAGIKAVSGVILNTAIELYGNEVLQLQAEHRVNRIVPVPVALSEIARLLAPPGVYQQAQERLAGQEQEAG